VTDTIKTVVLGASGYVGGELLRLIAAHPTLELSAAVSETLAGNTIGNHFPALAHCYPEQTFQTTATVLDAVDTDQNLALFSAAPHSASAGAIAVVLQSARAKSLNVHAVDSSADFRYKSSADFKAVYGIEHPAPQLLDQFTCSLPEHSQSINTPHIGHPGCFATAALLAAVPLFACGLAETEVFISGITGSTGAGRRPTAGTHHPERHSNLYAYNPLSHRHVPEIAALIRSASNEEVAVRFIPHSGPYARGIYITLQANLKIDMSADGVRQTFMDFYRDHPFAHVVTAMPRLKDVVASNYCHIGIATQGRQVVITSAIDNLVKGAAGGAMQWMNRLWSLPETSGLTAAAPAWT